MSSVHLLNVSPGDCTIIQHNSGRSTMIDICCGNMEVLLEKAYAIERAKPRGNFRMCEYSVNPISYARSLGIKDLFRFILSHPDMDHMDGFNALVDEIGISNFWDTGARRDKPDFGEGPYKESDWDRYVKVRDGKESGVSSAIRRAGSEFPYANKKDEQGNGHDGLHILAPDAELAASAKTDDDINNSSYVVAYCSQGGNILLPGDAHDASWEYAIKNHHEMVSSCAFLLAPHHGRDSDRSYDFLDVAKPKLTLIGCAPSKYIDYGQWSRRNLEYITSNQAGNIVLEITDDNSGIDVYIENESYATTYGLNTSKRNSQGYIWYRRL